MTKEDSVMGEAMDPEYVIEERRVRRAPRFGKKITRFLLWLENVLREWRLR